MRVVLIVLAVAAFLVVYGFWTARRLDRLHDRLDAAAAALHAQLAVRAEAAAGLARGAGLPPAAAASLADAATAAATASGLGHDREVVESALSRALQEAATSIRVPGPAVVRVVDEGARASFARRFHNDAVRDALIVRRRWVVRLFHLAGHAPRPAYFEMDDAPLVIADVAAAAAPYD